MPKLEEPLTYGYSFILVLASGFFVLIGGLIFVLSRQVGLRLGHVDRLLSTACCH